MGLPVVATRVSGIPEVVKHGVSGLLVGAEQPDAIADAVQSLIETPALAARLGHAAREAVQRDFDVERNLRVVLGLLETAHAHEARAITA